MRYIAHKRSSTGEIQPLNIHLEQVGLGAKEKTNIIGLPTVGYLAGVLHDAGKYSNEFQQYIRAAFDDPTSVTRGSVNHTSAGGLIIWEMHELYKTDRFKVIATELIANAIFSHHNSNGLRNFINVINNENSSSELKDRITRDLDPESDYYQQYLTAKKRFYSNCMNISTLKRLLNDAAREVESLMVSGKMKRRDFYYVSRYVFSALIDSDRTNTMQFEADDYSIINYRHVMTDFYRKNEENQKQWAMKANESQLNADRTWISNKAFRNAKAPTGIFTLNVPTGAGKTLTSLRFALAHAKRTKKERIIFVVPFNTILEQNADVIRKALDNEEFILEHHSNVIIESDDLEHHAQLQDNWSAPIIITSMVQILNVLFKKTTSARRMQNLSNSVIIFDEIQSVPIKSEKMLMDGIMFLKQFCNTTSVLCTATLPAYSEMIEEIYQTENEELVKLPKTRKKHFKRVESNYIPKTQDIPEFTEFAEEKINSYNNTLIIVNTKKAANIIYTELKDKFDFPIFHLSTNMCAAHRKYIIDTIRQLLASNEKCLVISTQLIEAGVDISFECVIRSMAGLDSIAQAAGRCNRNAEYTIGDLYIVKLDNNFEDTKGLVTIDAGKAISTMMLALNPQLDVFSEETYKLYYYKFFNRFKLEMEYPIENGINLRDLTNVWQGKFRNLQQPPIWIKNSPNDIVSNYEAIDSPTTSIVVRYENADLIQEYIEITDESHQKKLIKKLQPFTIQVWDAVLKELITHKKIKKVKDIYLLDQDQYDLNVGLSLSIGDTVD